MNISKGNTTILTGVNSSGKSSIIQSLLLVSQSIQSDSQIVLNGPLVRLGNAQDLVREGAEGGSIELTIDLEDDPFYSNNGGASFRAIFDLQPTEDRSSLRSKALKITSSGHTKTPFEMKRANSRAKDVEMVMNATRGLGPRDVLHVKSLLDNERRQLRTYVVVKGLRPVAVVQLMTPAQVGKKYRTLLEPMLHDTDTSSGAATSVPIAQIWGHQFIREFIRSTADSEAARLAFGDSFGKVSGTNIFKFEGKWRQLTFDQRLALIEAAVAARKDRPYVLLSISELARTMRFGAGPLEAQLTESLGLTLAALSSLSVTLSTVSQRVQYLGPLRDEPRVVWNHWNELARSLPVGTRGEYSAAVLSRSSATEVTYTRPGSEIVSATLSQAVNDWLNYLQIGDAVAARSHGKLGVGLDLRVNGKLRDLTSVGVGVSQTLPLLVGLLTAPRESIFIVEQPELHLHPAVQGRLADFMLNARPDLTLVIETHSESFITRIRRRAAEGKLDVTKIDITFVEPNRSGSSVRTLNLSEFGDLSEWPKGFLSSAEDDIHAILSANLERARGKSNA